MGDLEQETAVEGLGDGVYLAHLHPAWEIWGPMGGYVASIALRAVGRESPFSRPASFSCAYLGVAAFGAVEVLVRPLRVGKTAAAHRAEVTQGDKRILEATVWSVGDVEGLEHDLTEAPGVPRPQDLRSIPELLADAGIAPGQPPFPFWNNLESRPLDFRVEWPPPEPLPPVWREWCRFTPTPTFSDPWVDACRSLILVDVQSWPSASRPHASEAAQFVAPSLDLYVAFHRPEPDSDWLLCDGEGLIARDGVMGWNGRLWSLDGHLVASGTGQLLCRRLP